MISKNINKRSIKISLVVNILAVIMTILASIIMFTGFKFMHDYGIVLESTKIGMLRFFTVQSNIFVGIVSLLFAINEIKLLTGNWRPKPESILVTKLGTRNAVIEL